MDITVEVEKNGLWVAVASFKSTAEARKYISITKQAVSFEFKFDPVVATAIRITVRRVSNPTHPIQFYEVEALNTGK